MIHRTAILLCSVLKSCFSTMWWLTQQCLIFMQKVFCTENENHWVGRGWLECAECKFCFRKMLRPFHVDRIVIMLLISWLVRCTVVLYTDPVILWGVQVTGGPSASQTAQNAGPKSFMDDILSGLSSVTRSQVVGSKAIDQQPSTNTARRF